jgi:lysophospholipase L1-like esterase
MHAVYDGKTYTISNKEYGTTVKGYQSYMREKLGCVVINQGTNGYTMPLINEVIKSYDFSGIDSVTITSGANDYRNNVQIGTIQPIGSTFNNTTYIGAMQESIEFILNFNSEIKIYLLTPIKGWDNTVGRMPNAYPNAIKSIGELYSLSVCDWYNNSGINDITKSIYIGDVDSGTYFLHPSTKGYKRMADILIPFLENN